MFLCTITGTSERGRRHKLWRQTPPALKSAAPALSACLRARRTSLGGLGDQCYVSCCHFTHFASCIVPEEGTIMCSLEAGCSQDLSGEITSRRETPMVQLCQQPPQKWTLVCLSGRSWGNYGTLPPSFSPVPPVLIPVLIIKGVEPGTGRSTSILSC